MQPMPKIFNLVKDFGASGLRQKTIIGCYKDSGICETNVEKPLATHSLISNCMCVIGKGPAHSLKKRQDLNTA